MELAVVDRWTDASVFLDCVSRRMMKFQEHSLHLVLADSLLKTKLKLPSVEELTHAALSPDNQVLAFIQGTSRLVRDT